MPVDFFVVIHGMTPEVEPADLKARGQRFWERLKSREPVLRTRFCPEGKPPDRCVFVQWGHEPPDMKPDAPRRDDEKLTRAQKRIYDRVSYDAVRTRPGPGNILLSGFFTQDRGLPFLGGGITRMKEEIILRGFGDAVYYVSPEGEERVRRTVYSQVLGALEPFLGQEVRLHVVAHSLGVTVAHDFLFGLFRPGHHPDFLDQAADAHDAQLYKTWRAAAQGGQLTVGSVVSMASQLPLFVMRKQGLVDLLFAGGHLDPADIGVRNDAVRWLLFHDMDDLLGFPSRELYGPKESLKEIQVDNGLPWVAHSGYWENETVLRETAQLLVERSG